MERELRVFIPDIVPEHLVDEWLTGILEAAGVEVIEIAEV